MVARYNYLSGSDSDGIDSNNPNLAFIQDNTSPTSGYMSSTTVTGNMGILTDLLEWHHLDPVDDFEIQRNDILYRNYTNNRNPFIDYPDWVDYIWGTATYDGRTFQNYNSAPTGAADRLNDTIHAFAGEEEKEVVSIEVTKLPNKVKYEVGETFDKTGMVVTATYADDSTADVTSKCTISVDLSTAGEKVVAVSYKDKIASFKITVTELPWYKKSIGGTGIQMWMLLVAIPVLVVIIILVLVGVLKVNKKGKLKVNKSGVKKIVKGSSSKKSKK